MEAIKSLSGVLEKLIDFSLKSVWSLFFLFLLSAGLLYLNPTFLESIYVKDLRDQYISYIGFIYLASGTALLIVGGVRLGRLAVKRIQRWWRGRITKNRKLSWLNTLNDEQSEIVALFFLENTHILELPGENSDVRELEAMGIIHHHGFYRRKFFTRYSLDSEVRRYLKPLYEKHREDLEKVQDTDEFPISRQVPDSD